MYTVLDKHFRDRTQIVTYIQQEALVGEDSGEEQLFSSENTSVKGGINIELDGYLQKLKVLFFIFPTTTDPKKTFKS